MVFLAEPYHRFRVEHHSIFHHLERNMSEELNRERRALFGAAAAMTIMGAQVGSSGLARAATGDTKAGALSGVKPGTHTSFAPIKQINAGLLNVGYAEDGPSDGPAVVLLHGWPYDIHSYVDVAPLLASKGYRVIVPYLRGFGTTRFLASATLRNGQQSVVALDIIAMMDALKIQKAEFAWWYQYYFATQNGLAGYGKYTHDFAKLIWQQASPKWNFDDATFDRSAAAFSNPDHVAITIHNYRWRIGIAEGESKYDDLEKRLAKGSVISVPTITLEGDANGAPHAPPAAYRGKFSGKYEHRDLTGGVGHNLPQEAPQGFAQAIVDVDAI